MNRVAISLAMSFLFGVGLVTPATAQGDTKKEEPKKDAKTEEYEKAVKDLKKLDGNFTLYQRKKEILLELPEEKLGKLFLFQAAFNTGIASDTAQAGFPVGGNAVDTFRFEKNEDSVWLVRPNIRYRWDKSDPLAVASQRSFPEATLATFRIEATNTEKKLLLVNLTNLFYGDLLQLNDMIQAIAGPYMLERDKSGPDSVRSFPDNTVVRMKLSYFSPRGGFSDNPLLSMLGMSPQVEDERSIPFKVSYNFWWRKESGYMPRQSDPRVGYFTEDFYNVGRFSQDDRTDRYIYRWNLQKKDPKAALSEPVKPIVWYVDDTVPDLYRDAVKEGILYWNRAFEAIGYKNAVVVKDAPKNDPEWDHADGRFNVVRWAMSEDSSYAIALARVDPFTGEILNASVNMDAGMPQFAFWEYDKIVSSSNDNMDRAMAVLTRKHESLHPANVQPDAYLWEGQKAIAKSEFESRLKKFGWQASNCNYAREKMESAAEGWAALTAGGKLAVSPNRYATDFVRDVVSHEIGHCMGLRHNFIASTRNSTAELANDQLLRTRGLTASVMDYVPVNIQAVLKGNGVFFAPHVGEYDVWAIKYGYMDVAGAKDPNAEKFALARVASQSGLPQNRYMSDEQADSWDPAVVRHDNAKDPLNYSLRMMSAIKRIENYAINELPKPGQPYSKRTYLLNLVLRRTFREGRNMARFVGGIHGNKAFRGDAGATNTLAPVSASEQRLACQAIAKTCLSTTAFNWPENVMMNLSEDYNSDVAAGWSAPMRSTIASNMFQMYAQIMGEATLRRIAENQFKWGSDPKAYTLDEHFGTVLGSVFSEVGSKKSIPPIRRDLQRFAVQGLITQAGAPMGQVQEDTRMLATDSLRRLYKRYEAATKLGANDGMTSVYLRDTANLIGRFLNRQATGL